MLLKVPLDRLALILQIAGGHRQEHGFSARCLRRRARRSGLRRIRSGLQVLGEIVELHQELLLVSGPNSSSNSRNFPFSGSTVKNS